MKCYASPTDVCHNIIRCEPLGKCFYEKELNKLNFELDPRIPKDEIWFVNSKAEVVGKITNIGDKMADGILDKCQDPNGCQRRQDCLLERTCLFYELIRKNKTMDNKVEEITDKWSPTQEFSDGKGRPRNGNPLYYKLLEKMADTHDKKSHDYASNDNPMGNYHFAGMLGQLFEDSKDAGFVARIGEKLYRLANLQNSGKTALNETIEDTEIDIAVITLLWMADRQSRRGVNQLRFEGGSAGGGKTESLRKETERKLDEAIKKDTSSLQGSNLHHYKFHNELRDLLNRHGIDSELNVSDHTIVTKILNDLLIWKNQIS